MPLLTTTSLGVLSKRTELGPLVLVLVMHPHNLPSTRRTMIGHPFSKQSFMDQGNPTSLLHSRAAGMKYQTRTTTRISIHTESALFMRQRNTRRTYMALCT